MKPAADDRVWRELRRRLRALGKVGAHVKVGVFGSAGAHAGSGISMVEIAAVHEFGSPSIGVPSRSFIRAGILEKKEEMQKFLVALAKQVVTSQSRSAVTQALEKLGLWAQTAVKKKITGGDIPPPLAPATIARKGSSKPLVDTGQLVNSIAYQVGDRSGK